MDGNPARTCLSAEEIHDWLDRRAAARFEAHAEACGRCRAALASARELRGIEVVLRNIAQEEREGGADRAGSRTWLRSVLDDVRARFEPAERKPRRFSFLDFDEVAELRRGGQGTVYGAVQRSTGRRVALKVLNGRAALDSVARARFEREVHVLGRLGDEEGVCPILDTFTEGDDRVVVMPFIEGETLSEAMKRSRARRAEGASAHEAWSAILPSAAGGLGAAIQLLERLARAVHACHRRAVVHRDLSPRNVMLRADGRPVVLDFGLALEEDSSARLSKSGEILGTPVYIAPEQVEAATVDARSDVYALGAILYELLTYHAPFEGSRTRVVLQRILRGAFPSPRALEPAIPRDLEAVCLKAMELEPRRRYACALDFAEDLRRVRELESTVAKPLSPLGRLFRRARRNPWAAGGIAAAAVMAAVAFHFRARQTRGVDAVVHAAQVIGEGRAKGTFDEDELRDLKGLGLEPDAVRLVDEEYCKELLEQLGERHRAGDEPEIQLESPRSATTSLRPSFHFRLAPSAARTERLVRLETEAEGTVLDALPVAPASTDGELVSVELSVTLEPGTDYRWSVCDAAGNPEAVVTFRVVDPALVEARLAALKSSGDPAVDVLARAATELALGLATPALERLERFPDEAAAALQRLRRVLQARAYLLLGEQESARERLALADAIQSATGGLVR